MEGARNSSRRMTTGKHVHKSLVAAVVLALIGLLASIPSAAAQDRVTNPSEWDCSTTDLIPENPQDTLTGAPVKMQPDARGRWVPVIFVHGFISSTVGEGGAFSEKIDLTANKLGDPAGERSLIGQLQTIPGAATFSFDYHDTSARWVDDDANGPALGTAIDCLFDASGGEKVIVVAQSMGGLLTRYAFGEDPARAQRVSTVVTFGTPNTGSVSAQVLDTLTVPIRLFLAVCGHKATISMEDAGICANVVGAFTGEAGLALQAGSSELRNLAKWPPGVAVTALAGDIQFDFTQRSWFGIPVKTVRAPLGDLIVGLDSAIAGATSSESQQCSYQGNIVAAANDELLVRVGHAAANDTGQHGDMVSGPCFHTNLMRNLELTNTATGVVDEDIASRTGLAPISAGTETYTAADGYHPVIVVMDTSGSMEEAAPDGTRRIDAARASVLNYVNQLPQGTPFGLIAYPGSGKVVDGCSIGNVEIKPGPLDVVSTSAAVRRLSPDGETPTAPALKHAGEKLRTMGKHGTIILVSDGESNCGAEPVCETARKLSDTGIDVRVNTVGFNIDEGGRDELQCVSDITGGRYLDATDVSQLSEAMSEATGAKLEVSTSVPEQMAKVSGTGDGGTTVAVTVKNSSATRAEDVRVSLDFRSGDGTPGAIQVPRPVRFLGNIAPGEASTTEFVVRPDADLSGTFGWVMATTARNANANLLTGNTRLDDPFGTLSGLLGSARNIAVVGDSYASGEGIRDYTAGTDGDGNNCHRSDKAYGPLLAGTKNTTMIACSGAVTANFYDQQSSGDEKVAPQLQTLRGLATDSESPDAVFVSIGGNDIEFGPKAVSCILLSSCGSFDLQREASRIADVGNDLRRVYRDVNRAVNDDEARGERGGKYAPIVVVPYPRITPTDPIATPDKLGRDDPYAGCQFGIRAQEVSYFNDVLDALNRQIELAVASLQKERIPVYYARDVITAFQPNHTVCDGTESYAVFESTTGGMAANVAGIADQKELLHPNANGHQAMARSISAWASSTPAITDPVVPEWKSSTSTRMNGFLQKGAQFLWPFSAADIYRGGGEAEISADGYAPTSEVVFRVQSVPRVVGVATADANGHVEATVYLPTDLAPGTHHLRALGADASGAPHVESTKIRVAPPHSVLALITVVAGIVIAGLGILGIRRSRKADGTKLEEL